MDDEGVELGSGVMELTQSELVLHLHRREAVRWPYLCLRRYGYDSNLFSFESGRRCQTGQGEYQPLPHAGMGACVPGTGTGAGSRSLRDSGEVCPLGRCCPEKGRVVAKSTQN